MTGQLSTRMGTALRHAGTFLQDRRAHKKLILLVTDGEPSDIDVHDSQYLMFDAKKAVEENNRHGIFTYCMSLDPKADRYVSRIFGMRNYMVLDQHPAPAGEAADAVHAGDELDTTSPPARADSFPCTARDRVPPGT